LLCLLVGLSLFLRRRRKFRLEQDALRMSVVDPTPRSSQVPTLFSWMRRSRTESMYEPEAQLAAAKRAADPFGDDMKAVDLNEKREYGSSNPFADGNRMPVSLVPGGGGHQGSGLTW